MICGLYLALEPTPVAWLFFLVGVYLTWDFFRCNAVWMAFRQFRSGQIEQVRRLLSQVRWPDMLNKQARAYYHWLRGVVSVTDNRLGEAKVHLLAAASGQLKTQNDRCLVECLLAEVEIESGDTGAAHKHLQLAKKLSHHENVNNIIVALEQRL